MLVFDLVVNEFEFQWRNYIHFITNTLGKWCEPHITLAMVWIVPPLSLYEIVFGIK